jgi:hypothetical protein
MTNECKEERDLFSSGFTMAETAHAVQYLDAFMLHRKSYVRQKYILLLVTSKMVKLSLYFID